MKQAQRIIVVTGPTASGKSALAFRLASQLNGAIINADSVQIFKGADIGSAKPSRVEMSRIPHFLFSELSPHERIDAVKFSRLADRNIQAALDLRCVPIVAGGTGLYLKSLLHGLLDLPANNPKTPLFDLNSAKVSDLYKYLKEIDAKTAARLSPTDEVRIRRAIDICNTTSQSVADLRDQHSFQEIRYSALVVVCAPDREKLYDIINNRTRQIIARGLLRETRELQLAYGSTSQIFKAIGYKEALAVLNGDLSAKDLAAEVSKNTRRLAKRQFTWWRNEPAKLGWTVDKNIDNSSEGLFNRLSTFLVGESELAEDRIYVRFFDPHGI